MLNDLNSDIREKELKRIEEIFAYSSIYSVERRLLAGEPVSIREVEETIRRLDEKPPEKLSKKDQKIVRAWLQRNLYRLRIRKEQEMDWRVP